MSDFSVNFGEIWAYAKNEATGENEEGEQNIFNSTSLVVNYPYELIPDARIRLVATTFNDVVFGVAHHGSDGAFSVRDGFELAGGVLGGLVGGFVGSLLGGLPAAFGAATGSTYGEGWGGDLYDSLGSVGRDWSHTVAVQVHGQDGDQLAQRFSIIGSKWENGQRVDIIHVSENGPAGPKQWIYTVPDGQAEIDRLNAEDSAIGPAAGTTGTVGNDHCFLADATVQMWPVDKTIKPSVDGIYDEQHVLSKVWVKPISDILVGDLVVSYDDKGRIKPAPVTRTMTNTATHLLDFWNTGVTPGHAYYCADGKFKDQHVPLMDILRTDGAIMLADGTMIRAATNCKVGSMGDMMIHASATLQNPDGTWTEPKPGKVRFGTRIILPDGRHMSFMEMAASEGWKVTDDGYMVGMMKGEDGTVEERAFHFPYSHGEELPKPEDYILARSKVSLEAIYAAGEWEQIGTRMPAPVGMVGLNTNHTSTLLQPSKPEPNLPPAFDNHPDAPHRRRLNRTS